MTVKKNPLFEKVKEQIAFLLLGALVSAGGLAVLDHFAIAANANDIKEIRESMATSRDIDNIAKDIVEIKGTQTQLLNIYLDKLNK